MHTGAPGAAEQSRLHRRRAGIAARAERSGSAGSRGAGSRSAGDVGVLATGWCGGAGPPSLGAEDGWDAFAEVCLRPDSPLARLDTVGVTDLLTEPLIVMRSGYLMHRYVHRLPVGGRLRVCHPWWRGRGVGACST